MFTRCLRADFYKMKRSSVIIAHIIIPIVVSAVFLAYYAISGWNETDKITAFYETLGSAFPVLIGIFTASIMEQEQNAGAFQNLLTLRSRTAALFSKVVTLLGLISGLISALFLTDIGMYVWKIVPLSWTARIPETFLAYELADRGALSEIKSHAPIYLVVVAVCFAGYFAFATNYEGSKISE